MSFIYIQENIQNQSTRGGLKIEQCWSKLHVLAWNVAYKGGRSSKSRPINAWIEEDGERERGRKKETVKEKENAWLSGAHVMTDVWERRRECSGEEALEWWGSRCCCCTFASNSVSRDLHPPHPFGPSPIALLPLKTRKGCILFNWTHQLIRPFSFNLKCRALDLKMDPIQLLTRDLRSFLSLLFFFG